MANRSVVLVVEDEILVQTTLCATLTHVGFSTHRADSVEGALRILGAEHVDAVMLDIRLPDSKGQQRSGLTLLAFLRATAEYAQVPVLIFTGVPLSADDEALARKYDAQIFYKPTPYATLIDTLAKMLAVKPASTPKSSALPDPEGRGNLT
jgi:DNA-binding response OmpR family regulator